MLTLDEVMNISFRKANIGGYRHEDVDEFIDNVIDSYKELVDQKKELEKQVKSLTKKVDEYEKDEDYLKNALINVQRLSDSSIRDAKHRADVIIKDAKLKAEKIISDTQGKINEEKFKLDVIKNEVSSFKNKLKETYKSHLKLIDSLPETTIQEEKTSKQDEDKDSKEIKSKSDEIAKEDSLTESVNAEKEKADAKVKARKKKPDKKRTKLKFGEDYNVADDEDSPIGLFD